MFGCCVLLTRLLLYVWLVLCRLIVCCWLFVVCADGRLLFCVVVCCMFDVACVFLVMCCFLSIVVVACLCVLYAG